ncbi:DUF6461 domain-containing protein [Streptomyces sp. NPDC102365]|uniref:DUF6461 domain-containing protein n=1 Tax=Streptomyces sp. NPDC102365 TaxID=3366162 RepID=UPI0037FF2D8F
MRGEYGLSESLGDRAPVSAITDGRFLLSGNGNRMVVRRPDGGLDCRRDRGAGSTGLSADEARALELPGTELTWRFLSLGGWSAWVPVLVDEQDSVVWVQHEGFFPSGYRSIDTEPTYEPSDVPEPWMDYLGMGEHYCVTLIQNVTPHEALRRFGASDDDISTSTWYQLLNRAAFEEVDHHRTHVVAAFALGPHALLAEDIGNEGVHRPDLSVGTFAVSAFRSLSTEHFSVSRDGVELASMHLSSLCEVEGTHPDAITKVFPEMGIDDVEAFEDDPETVLNDLELLRRIAGIAPTVADLAGQARVAIIPSG